MPHRAAMPPQHYECSLFIHESISSSIGCYMSEVAAGNGRTFMRLFWPLDLV